MHKPICYVVDLNSGCHNCTSHYMDKWGYAWIRVEGKRMTIPRYVYEQYNKVKILPGYVVRHACDNPSCINPLHLTVGSPKDNAMDRVLRGRGAYGERNGRSKLVEVQVEEILKSDLPNSRLAQIYRVDPKVIRQIKNGELWKHIFKRVYLCDNNYSDNLVDMEDYKKQNTHHNESFTAPNEAV